MMRSIGGVLLGYLALFFVVFAGLSGAYVLLGAERSFRPGLYEVSPLWIVVSILVSFAAALFGGWVARRVTRTIRGPRILAGVVLVLGLLLVLPVLTGDPATPAIRGDALGPFEAMQQARTPTWLMLLNPLLGALGVLLGGRALAPPAERAP